MADQQGSCAHVGRVYAAACDQTYGVVCADCETWLAFDWAGETVPPELLARVTEWEDGSRFAHRGEARGPKGTPMMDLEDLGYYVQGDENALLGTAIILGAAFHLTAIRVETTDDGGQYVHGERPTDGAGDEPSVAAQLWEHFLEFEEPDGPVQTVNLPGYEGDWAIWLTPKPD